MPSLKHQAPVLLIVNADDFGYFSSVSSGIIECARRKVITATGIMANGPRLGDTKDWLLELPDLDVGVHLNITLGSPLSSGMKACLTPYNGVFQNRLKTAWLILSKKVPVSVVIEEWRLQIVKCMSMGFKIRFINSHEHLHMLPSLFKSFVKLGKEFNIPFIRLTQPEFQVSFKPTPLFRNLILLNMLILNLKNIPKNYYKLIGTGVSCQLNLEYLENRFKKMKRGCTYELMCHPGYYDSKEINNPWLVNYQSWEDELRLLTGEPLAELLRKYNVKLVKFGELKNE